jgi:hypothetical protein
VGFIPSLLKKQMTECCSLLVHVASWGSQLYTTSAPLRCIPSSYYHISATLQAMGITVVNLQDNQAVFEFLSHI